MYDYLDLRPDYRATICSSRHSDKTIGGIDSTGQSGKHGCRNRREERFRGATIDRDMETTSWLHSGQSVRP